MDKTDRVTTGTPRCPHGIVIARDKVCVCCHGAVGDGITNDAVAVMGARRALGDCGGTLEFPIGRTYRIDQEYTEGK